MHVDYRSTKIIVTLGPATESEEMLRQLCEAGADVFRLNMAHAEPDWVHTVVARIRRVSEVLNRPVPVALDIKGPEIRTGDLSEPLELALDDRLDLTVDQDDATPRDGVPVVSVNYPGIVEDVAEGATVLIDGGLLALRVEGKSASRLHCRVTVAGELGNRRHINLPGTRVRLPSVTERDREHVRLGAEVGVDSFMMSFVRDAEAISELREVVEQHGMESWIIAKIEDQSAISNLEAIIDASDMLMIARGDLAVESPFEELPLVQMRTANLCKHRGKPFIVATQMLESMITEPMPTRAEISDVATAVQQRADCVMLSGETTVGRYPVRCVEIMAKIAKRIEESLTEEHWKVLPLESDRDQVLHAAVVLAQHVERVAYLLYTTHGLSAKVLAALRPQRRPILAFTPDRSHARLLRCLYGVEPFLCRPYDKHTEFLGDAVAQLQAEGRVQSGDGLVAIDYAGAESEHHDTIQLYRLP